jgi:hypothetical protein
VRPLWGTAALFKHPRYAHGAATSPQAAAFAHGAAQVKKAMEVTHRLGGLNYVFWGGREGRVRARSARARARRATPLTLALRRPPVLARAAPPFAATRVC